MMKVKVTSPYSIQVVTRHLFSQNQISREASESESVISNETRQ